VIQSAKALRNSKSNRCEDSLSFKAKPMVDTLQELLDLQKNLARECNYGDRTPAELGVAIAAEGLEMWDNEGKERNGKWWKKPVENLLQAQKEEAIDILHFWLQLCLELEIDSDEIVQLYKRKMEKNISRQKEGY
jgi:NTP pyrophosphatase (non-canonical NTP hydrolase)